MLRRSESQILPSRGPSWILGLQFYSLSYYLFSTITVPFTMVIVAYLQPILYFAATLLDIADIDIINRFEIC